VGLDSRLRAANRPPLVHSCSSPHSLNPPFSRSIQAPVTPFFSGYEHSHRLSSPWGPIFGYAGQPAPFVHLVFQPPTASTRLSFTVYNPRRGLLALRASPTDMEPMEHNFRLRAPKRPPLVRLVYSPPRLQPALSHSIQAPAAAF